MHPKQYAQLLYEVLENKTEEQQTQIIGRLKNTLIKNRETHLSRAIAIELEKIQKKEELENTTYIASASELSIEQQKELEKLFPAPRKFLKNASLLGGISVRKKDEIYNSTLKKKLESIKSLL